MNEMFFEEQQREEGRLIDAELRRRKKEELKEELIMTGKMCPYCGDGTVHVDSAEIYHGVSYGMIYLCRKCRAYVGCHKSDGTALGRLANAELREWKKKAHAAFDPLWKQNTLTRNHAYAALADYMTIDREHCHIGMFDVDQCKQVIEFIKAFKTIENEKQ